MGLDMYLDGEIFFTTLEDHKRQVEAGYETPNHILELGYWRKHPDLHGFIVETFNNGIDDCKPIQLEVDDIDKIIRAIEENNLPKTSGFFFGESLNDQQEQQSSIEIFKRARKWLTEEQNGCCKFIVYQASG